jgi:transcriptional regulator with XRE-family HTH domain
MTRNERPKVSLSFVSGLYTRVARRMGVHPSYVSRIARGERRSERISQAIATELAQFAQASDAGIASSAQSGIDSESRALLGRKVAKRLKSNPRLRKLSVMVIDVSLWKRHAEIGRVSRVNLEKRIASNAAMIAGAVEHFHRLSARLEKFPHVLSLVDAGGIVLYSYGTTGMVRQEQRVPGADWSTDQMGPSAAARAIASGVPVVLLGMFPDDEGLLTARLSCPIRLSNREVVGVIDLSLDLERIRPEHLLDLSRVAKKICKLLDSQTQKQGRSANRNPVQPFEEAELHLARVMSLPQLEHSTRAYLAGLLADLESTRREILLKGESVKKSSRAKADAQGVS